MDDTLKVIETQSSGFSDTVLLAIVAALLAIATLIIKGIIEAQAKKAALEAARVTQKLAEVEIKMDGRLTQLLEIATKEAEERGHRLGKEMEKKEEKDRAQEASAPTTPVELPGTDPMKLKITEGEIKVIPETKKKK